MTSAQITKRERETLAEMAAGTGWAYITDLRKNLVYALLRKGLVENGWEMGRNGTDYWPVIRLVEEKAGR